MVFKPVYSRFASRAVIGPSRRSLKRIDPAAEQWIAQRRINGSEYSTYSVAIDGQLLAHCSYHSLYRVGTGSGICFQPVEIPEIESFVREFVRRVKYTGQIGFDIIIDANDRLWVLEGNPRATSGAQLFAKSDRLVDALLPDVAEASGSQLIKPSTFRPGMIEFAMPVWGVVDAVRRGRIHRFPFDVLRSRWLCCSLRDFWPALGLPLSFWQLIRIARREKCSLQQASTFDIEWNGEDL